MSSNYPNMSYCMMENTRLALDQVLGAMLDAVGDNRAAEFVQELNRTEQQSYSTMYDLCRQFINLADQIEEARVLDIADGAEIEDDDSEWNASNGQGD